MGAAAAGLYESGARRGGRVRKTRGNINNIRAVMILNFNRVPFEGLLKGFL